MQATASSRTTPRTRSDASRLAKLHPLPGGARRYQQTLDALLVDERCGAPADAARSLLEGAGLVARSGDDLALTELGRRYREAPDAERLFDLLHGAYLGLLETLVLVDTPEVTGGARLRRLLEGAIGKRWRTPAQTSVRRNWLLSLGLTDRGAEGDRLTPLGRQVLGAHAAEAAEIRRRIGDLLEEELEASFAAFDARAVEAELDARDDETCDDEPAPVAPGHAPPGWASRRLDLSASRVRPHLGALELPDRLLHRVCAALSAGKHLLFVGPPGTGKTELAAALGEAARAEGYCRGALSCTASADWTTFDTIGGYALEKDGALRFRPGVFLAAIERQAWLLVDELNRADVDRALGELMTVLAGRGTVTPFAGDDGRLVSIGPEPGATHRVPPAFRLLATMNTWDKSSLFRLSYAVQRRFAIVHVPVPDDAAYARLLARHAAPDGVDPALDPRALAALVHLFRSEGLLAHRPVGPAVPIDMIRYLRRRGDAGEGLPEAFAMYLLPQLEGLDPRPASAAYTLLDAAVAGLAGEPARAELRARWAELFPHHAAP